MRALDFVPSRKRKDLCRAQYPLTSRKGLWLCARTAGHDSSAKAKVAAAMAAIEAAETEGGRPPKERAGK
jgi:hypothetical protein